MRLYRYATREGTRGIRAWVTLHGRDAALIDGRIEAYVASGARHTGIGLSVDDGVDGVLAFVGVRHVVNVWVAVGSTALAARLRIRYLPDVHIARIDFHDRAVWWQFWTDKWGWSSATPRWRDGVWHWWDTLTGKAVRTSEIIDGPTDVLVPMPEGTYVATATIERSTWRRPRWPWPRTITTAKLDVVSRPGPDGPYLPEVDDDGRRPAGYIPTPGKGENPWDCGPDGTFAMSCPARTIEDGVGQLVASVLRDRRRRGAPATYAEPIQ